MISETLRQAILTLSDQGRGLREISRVLKLSRNTVRRVVRAREHPSTAPEPLQLAPIAALLPALFRRCQGNAVRIQEILKAEHAIDVPYSTLTRLIREHTALRAPKKRSGRYHFGLGEERRARHLPAPG